MSPPPFRQITGVFEAVFLELQKIRPDVALGLGAARKHDHETIPRIVVVPTGDSFAATEQPPNFRDLTEPAPLWTALVSFEASIWGADIDETEELRRVFVQVLEECLGRAYTLDSGTWDTEGETAEIGIAYELLFSLKLPVTLFSSTKTTAKIGSIPLTKTVVTP